MPRYRPAEASGASGPARSLGRNHHHAILGGRARASCPAFVSNFDGVRLTPSSLGAACTLHMGKSLEDDRKNKCRSNDHRPTRCGWHSCRPLQSLAFAGQAHRPRVTDARGSTSHHVRCTPRMGTIGEDKGDRNGSDDRRPRQSPEDPPRSEHPLQPDPYLPPFCSPPFLPHHSRKRHDDRLRAKPHERPFVHSFAFHHRHNHAGPGERSQSMTDPESRP